MIRVIAAVVTASTAGSLASGGTALGSTALGGTASGSRATVASSARTASPAVIPATAWPAYLDGPRHESYASAETAITPATAPDLQQAWSAGLGEDILASPTVADGSVFIGSSGGWLYRLSEQTGAVLAKTFVGHQRGTTCPSRGVVSTATYAVNPATGQGTVYVAGPSGYLYALRANNLSLEWRSAVGIPSGKANNYFNWSSPTVANGKVYIGVASNCDHPLVRGAVIGYNQATGKKIAEFYTVPRGRTGGSVWSSIGVDAHGDVYATTGNGPAGHPRAGYSESIIRLSPALRLLGRFQVPARQVIHDGDFGASPVIFGSYVGACNKNGVFYLLNQSTMKVAWEQRISAHFCLTTPDYDGTNLFFAGTQTTIDVAGTPTGFPGSVQERDAASGTLAWATGLPYGAVGSPALNAGGVVTVGLYSHKAPDGVGLLNAATGALIGQLASGSDFSQCVFADDMLFGATSTGMYAWRLPSA